MKAAKDGDGNEAVTSADIKRIETLYERISVKDDPSAILELQRLAQEEHNHLAASYLAINLYNKSSRAQQLLPALLPWLQYHAQRDPAEYSLTPTALFILGRYHFHGIGVPLNKSEACRLFKLAADYAHILAQHWVGVCYYYGYGVPRSLTDAIRWHRVAADSGYACAQYKLGACYFAGSGVKLDKAEATRWWRLAANNKHPAAQLMMGYCYRTGDGVTANVAAATRWYQRSADNGCIDTRFELEHLRAKYPTICQYELQRRHDRWIALWLSSGQAGLDCRKRSILHAVSADVVRVIIDFL